jgi:hypothetical protein
MGHGRYPLAALHTLRVEAQDGCARALADAVRTLEDARHALEHSQFARDAHDTRTAEVTRDEQALDLRGRTVAEALHRTAYAARRRLEREALAVEVERARAAVEHAAQARADAQAALAHARAEREALDQHRARWQQAQALVVARRDEEDAPPSRRRGEGCP